MIFSRGPFVLLALFAAPAAVADPGDVLDSFPAPGFHSTGLAWDGSHLWLTNIAEAAHPETFWYRFYRIDPTNGAPVDSFPTWPSFYHGIGWDGTHLWGEHNWDTLTRLTTSGGVVTNLDAPVFFTYGVAYDIADDVLWVTAFQGQAAIFKLDPTSGEQLDRLEPAEKTTDSGWADLAWDGTHLWHSNTTDDVVYKIDPSSAEILDSFVAPAPDCSGLTFDGTSLWLASSTSDSIYRVDAGLAPVGVPMPAELSRALSLRLVPNPAPGEAWFELSVPGAGRLDVGVYDVAGREIDRFSRRVGAGAVSIPWSGGPGRRLPSGTYFVRTSLGEHHATGRLVVTR